jgi:hypothetical protein
MNYDKIMSIRFEILDWLKYIWWCCLFIGSIILFCYIVFKFIFIMDKLFK